MVAGLVEKWAKNLKSLFDNFNIPITQNCRQRLSLVVKLGDNVGKHTSSLSIDVRDLRSDDSSIQKAFVEYP